MSSAQASSRGPLVCFTNSKLAANGVMTWTGGATLTVTNQHLVVTDHAASALALRGKLPANQWAILSIFQITSAFAASEVINVNVYDSDLYLIDRYLNKSVTVTNMYKSQDMQSDHVVEMYIPPGGYVEISTDGALTLNDDLTTAIWGHVYTVSS